jgi:pre-rRNA-processing protein TSR3
VLNPISETVLSSKDRDQISKYGLTALDCSWNKAEPIFKKKIRGLERKLPPLLAGNPTNYGILGKLSTAEAIAAALIITGYEEHGKRVLSLFKWGPTFTSLNQEVLESYAKGEIY